MKDSKEVMRELISRQNLKSTQSRQLIVDYIFSEDKHFTAEQLIDGLKVTSRTVSKATVYRTLAIMVDAGLIQEHNFNTGEKVYEIAVDKPHHDHLYCDRCGSIQEFYNPDEESMIERVIADYQFAVTSHVFKIYGLCAKCRDDNK